MFGTRKLKLSKFGPTIFLFMKLALGLKSFHKKDQLYNISFICGLKVTSQLYNIQKLAWYQFCQIDPRLHPNQRENTKYTIHS